MVEGKKKSRRLRRIYTKIPGGKTVIHYKPRKPSRSKCSECEAILFGMPALKSKQLKNIPISKKRPERPYGGKLCSACMRKKILEKI